MPVQIDGMQAVARLQRGHEAVPLTAGASTRMQQYDRRSLADAADMRLSALHRLNSQVERCVRQDGGVQAGARHPSLAMSQASFLSDSEARRPDRSYPAITPAQGERIHAALGSIASPIG
jgi:hypothetical protein